MGAGAGLGLEAKVGAWVLLMGRAPSQSTFWSTGKGLPSRLLWDRASLPGLPVNLDTSSLGEPRDPHTFEAARRGQAGTELAPPVALSSPQSSRTEAGVSSLARSRVSSLHSPQRGVAFIQTQSRGSTLCSNFKKPTQDSDFICF